MNAREATIHDLEDIQTLLERSFRASYSLSPKQIDIIIESEFSPDAFQERIDDPDGTILVATEPEESTPELDVLGYAELHPGGALRWLHVHPGARGRGIGSTLLERVQEDADTEDRSFSAIVLESASEGDQFLERVGLSRTGGSEITIGGEPFHVQEYELADREQNANEPEVDVPETIQHEGETLSLDEEDEVSGTLAPIYPLFRDDEHAGFFCSQCGTTGVTAGTLDRLECSECGNLHRADEWDPGYL